MLRILAIDEAKVVRASSVLTASENPLDCPHPPTDRTARDLPLCAAVTNRLSIEESSTVNFDLANVAKEYAT